MINTSKYKSKRELILKVGDEKLNGIVYFLAILFALAAMVAGGITYPF